jgi:hypothetical protein
MFAVTSFSSLRCLVERAACEDAPVAEVLSAIEALAGWSHDQGVREETLSVSAGERELFLATGALSGLLSLVLTRCPLYVWRTSERATLLTASIFRFGPAGQVVLAVDQALREVSKAAGELAARKQRTRWLAEDLFERHFVRVPGRLLTALVGVRPRATPPFGWVQDHEAAPDRVLRCMVAIPELVTNALQRALPETSGLHPSRYPASLAWAVVEWLLACHRKGAASEPAKREEPSALSKGGFVEVASGIRAGTRSQVARDDQRCASAQQIEEEMLEQWSTMLPELVSEMIGRLARQLCSRGQAHAWCLVALRAWSALERHSCSAVTAWKQGCIESFTNVPDRHVAVLMEELACLGFQSANREREIAVHYLQYLGKTREAAVTFVSRMLPISTPRVTSCMSPLAASGDQGVLLFLLRACAPIVSACHWRIALTLSLQRWCETAQSAARWGDDLHTTRMILFLARFADKSTAINHLEENIGELNQQADWIRMLGKGLEAHLAAALPEMHYHGMLVAETLSEISDPSERKLRFAIPAYEAWKARDPEALRQWSKTESCLPEPIGSLPQSATSCNETKSGPLHGSETARVEQVFRQDLIASSISPTTHVPDHHQAEEDDDDDLQPYPLPPEELAIDPNIEPTEDLGAPSLQSAETVPNTFEALCKAIAAYLQHRTNGITSGFSAPPACGEPFAFAPDSIPLQVLVSQLRRLVEHRAAGLDHWALTLLRLLRQLNASTELEDNCCGEIMRLITTRCFASVAPSIGRLVFMQNMTLRERSEWLHLISDSVADLVLTKYVASRDASQTETSLASTELLKGIGGHPRRLSVRSLLVARQRQANKASSQIDAREFNDGLPEPNDEPRKHLDAIAQVLYELMARADIQEAWLDLHRRDQLLLAQLIQTASLLLYSAQGPASVCIGAATRLVSMIQALAEVAYSARTCSDTAVHRAIALALQSIGEALAQVVHLHPVRSSHELEQLWAAHNGGCAVSLIQLISLMEHWSTDEPDQMTRQSARAAFARFSGLGLGHKSQAVSPG